jgi:lipopolysaccharide export LptBFGC system permease protein LptF
MPTTTVVYLIVVIVVFALFGIVLAWGEYRTRNLIHNTRPVGDKSATAPAPPDKAAARRAREMT